VYIAGVKVAAPIALASVAPEALPVYAAMQAASSSLPSRVDAARRAAKRKDSGLQHHGGLNNPGTGGEILFNGVLVIGGAALALQLDQRVAARPMGIPPSALALAGTITVAVVAGKYKRRKLARGAAAVAIGIATGIVAGRIAKA